jgi:hypothetical protein
LGNTIVNLSSNDIRMIAEAERMMDGGHPFVMLDGQRVMCRQEVMDELGLKQGQTINGVIFEAILRQNLAHCQAQIAIKKAQETASRKT